MIDPTLEEGAARPIAILRITGELLRAALKLPEGTRIVGVSHDLFFTTDEIAIKIEHPDFPLVRPTQSLPERVPLYRERRVAEFAGWQES